MCPRNAEIALPLVKITHAYADVRRSSIADATARASYDGTISIVGSSTGSAPTNSNSRTIDPDCDTARVTTTRRPRSGSSAACEQGTAAFGQQTIGHRATQHRGVFCFVAGGSPTNRHRPVKRRYEAVEPQPAARSQ